MSASSSANQQPRRPSKAEIRAAARRRAQRRNLGSTLAVVAVVALIAVLVMTAGRSGGGGQPATTGDVQVSSGPHDGVLAAGEMVPDFSAPGLSGGRVSWSDYGGSPTVLAIWASWCPHCQAELPRLAAVMKEFPNVKLVTIVTAIGLNPGPSPKQYMADHNLAFPVAVDDSDGTLSQAFGIASFPTTYYVGSDGKVRQATTGETDETTLRSMVGSLT